ncbi:pancreatic lipase-related protein 2-like [Physella acuta]|uniref:pancreatic lipase-related protein 2-like n=1 Tax=Physella acuta TaxID=109671 RepID=UPI0027DC306E|nr:pancreatic lipase-related protein 2-like [Physella acuta]
MLWFRLVCLIILGTACAPLAKSEGATCYKNIGCFFNEYPYYSSARKVPLPDNDIQPSFILYTRNVTKPGLPIAVEDIDDLEVLWLNLKNRSTQILIHDFTHIRNKSYTDEHSWMHEMKDELLKHGDYNVILVDWSKSTVLPFSRAVSNSRVVAAYIAKLVKQLLDEIEIPASDIHLIGHGLGAHIAGYVGKRFQKDKIGRITGLDPSSPLFELEPSQVRLDKDDAELVDVIHTSMATDDTFDIGIKIPVGHMDFYPNRGYLQPGCEPRHNVKQNVHDIDLLVNSYNSCSHDFAVKIFTESINSPCYFLSFPCNFLGDHLESDCHDCGAEGCAVMGLNAHTSKPLISDNVTYVVKTDGKSPLCLIHLDLDVLVGTNNPFYIHNSNLILIANGTNLTEMIHINKDPMTLVREGLLNYTLELPSSIGYPFNISLQWTVTETAMDSNSTTPEPINTLTIDTVRISSEPAGNVARFCIQEDFLTLIKDIPVTIDNPCSRT